MKKKKKEFEYAPFIPCLCFFTLLLLTHLPPLDAGTPSPEMESKENHWVKTPGYIYGKDFDGWSESVKNEQRNHGKKLLREIAEAKTKGGGIINLSETDYRFRLDDSQKAKNEIISLKGIDGLTINGNGANFWFETYKTGITITDCKSLAINNIHMDWDPLPFSQGFIVQVDPQGKFIDVNTESGFRKMSDILADPFCERKRNDIKVKFYIFNAKTGLLSPDVAHCNIKSIQDLGGGVLRYHGIGFGGIPFNKQNIHPGDRVATIMRLTHAIRILSSEDIHFENINLYSSPMFGITHGSGGGGLVLRGCKLIPRPGTKRIMGINGDALHFTNLEKKQLIENCEIATPGDDCLNIRSDFNLVQKQINPKQVLIAMKDFRNISKGGRIKFYDWDTLTLKGEATVVATKVDPSQKADAKAVGGEKKVIFWPANSSFICEFDQPVNVKRGDLVESVDCCAKGTIIRNNLFRDATTRGLLIQTKDCLVENNQFVNIACAGVAVMSSANWCEGPFPDKIVIRNNEFKNTNFGYNARLADNRKIGTISVITEYRDELKKGVRNTSNVTISDNKLFENGTCGIFIIHANGVLIQNNLINEYFTRDPFQTGNKLDIDPSSGVYIGDSENIQVVGNHFEKPGPYAKERVTLGPYTDPNSIQIRDP